MYKHITIYTLFLLLLIACGSSERGRMLAVLDEADSLNRNYIPFTTDSALKIAAEWFDSHGSANERVRAHYLLGCAYRDMGEAPAALQSYHDAINCADTAATDCDYRLLSRVHGQMATLFLEQENPHFALLSIYNLQSSALKAKDTLMYIIGYEQKANAYEALERVDSVVTIEENASRMYLERGDTAQAARALGASLRAIVNRPSLFEKYMKIFEKYSGYFDESGNIKKDYVLYYYYKGLYFLNINQTDSAEYYFRKLQRSHANIDFNCREACSKGLYLLYKRFNQKDSVAKYAEQAYNINDSIIKEMSTTSIQRIQSHYDYTRHQQIALEKTNANTRYRLILIVSSFLIVILVFIILLYVTHARKRQTEQRNIETELSMRINQLEKEKSLRELSDIEEQLQCNPIVIRFHHYAENPPAMPTNADWVELRKLIQKAYPNFTKTLQSSGHLLRNEEIQICILIRLNFHMKHISNLMGMRMSTIANIRKRLLYKLFNKKEGSALDFDKQIRAI